jgi:hypothetical protein
VLLRRHGELQLPVEVAVRFDDGSERLLRWQTDGRVVTLDGQEPPLQVLAPRGEQGRWTRLRYVAQARVVEAECDPRRLLALEHDRTNDGLSDRPARPGAALGLAVRTLGWVQQLTTWYGGL